LGLVIAAWAVAVAVSPGTAVGRTGAEEAHATLPGWIAYSYRYYYKSDSGEVFVVRPDGSHRHRVTPLEPWSDDVNPTWSPDGAQIAYARYENNPGIYVIGADGQGQRPLTSSGHDDYPAWSSTGRIAFVRSSSIWAINVDGTDARQLTHGHDDALPGWSPDGQRIVFSRGQAVWVMKADGTHLRRLVRRASSGSWSPDGHRMLVATETGDIVVMNTDATHRRVLAAGGAPSWSPDGRRITFLSGHNGLAIYVMDATGRRQHRIVQWQENMSGPVWGRG
jgi:Tol biopolymer transport system component